MEKLIAAFVAQWLEHWFSKPGSRVQFSPEAFYNQQYILIFTINIDCISTFILVIRQTIPPCEKI